MRDISARELKGHNILAVERFQDSTRWMIEFSVQRPCSYGCPGDDMRLFLTEDGYQAALVSQKRREIKIKRYARVIEGHVLDFKPDKRRRHTETIYHYVRKGMNMCTDKSIKDAIRESCQYQYDMVSSVVGRVLQTIPFSEHEPMFSHAPNYKRPYQPSQ